MGVEAFEPAGFGVGWQCVMPEIGVPLRDVAVICTHLGNWRDDAAQIPLHEAGEGGISKKCRVRCGRPAERSRRGLGRHGDNPQRVAGMPSPYLLTAQQRPAPHPTSLREATQSICSANAGPASWRGIRAAPSRRIRSPAPHLGPLTTAVAVVSNCVNPAAARGGRSQASRRILTATGSRHPHPPAFTFSNILARSSFCFIGPVNTVVFSIVSGSAGSCRRSRSAFGTRAKAALEALP